MSAKACPFKSEADLVAAFCEFITKRREIADRRAGHDDMRWTIYAETAGFDLLLVQDSTGVQIGIEAKLTLNLKVLEQCLPTRYDGFGDRPTVGPDYRAVLVPRGGTQKHLTRIAELLGLTVLRVYNTHYDPSQEEGFEPWPGYVKPAPDWAIVPGLPDETDNGLGDYGDHWHSWLPEERCELPGYVPDVPGGVKSPVKLTPWKVKAIKLMVLLDRNGFVTRADMRCLKIGPTMWTGFDGWLDPDKDKGGYVRSERTPDFRAQHPRVYAEIEADYEKWAREAMPGLFVGAA